MRESPSANRLARIALQQLIRIPYHSSKALLKPAREQPYSLEQYMPALSEGEPYRRTEQFLPACILQQDSVVSYGPALMG